MTDDDTLHLADRLFRAIEAGDLDAVAACYDPDIVVWANFDGRDQDKAPRRCGCWSWLCAAPRRPPLRGHAAES